MKEVINELVNLYQTNGIFGTSILIGSYFLWLTLLYIGFKYIKDEYAFVHAAFLSPFVWMTLDMLILILLMVLSSI